MNTLKQRYHIYSKLEAQTWPVNQDKSQSADQHVANKQKQYHVEVASVAETLVNKKENGVCDNSSETLVKINFLERYVFKPITVVSMNILLESKPRSLFKSFSLTSSSCSKNMVEKMILENGARDRGQLF